MNGTKKEPCLGSTMAYEIEISTGTQYVWNKKQDRDVNPAATKNHTKNKGYGEGHVFN